MTITIPPEALRKPKAEIALMLYGEQHKKLSPVKMDVCNNIPYADAIRALGERA